MDEEKKYTYHIFIVLIFLAMPVLIFLIFILTIYEILAYFVREILAYFVRQIPKVICFLMKKGISFIIEIVKMEKLRKVFTTIMILLITLAIIGMLYDAFMPSVMKYPHDLVQSFSSDVIENESNVLRRNINDTVENVNIDIKQSNENVGKKEDYIKKEYLDSATYSYNVINTISGILVPLFTFIALVVAYNTFLSQKEQLEIQKQQLKDQKEQVDKQLEIQEQQLKDQKEQADKQLKIQKQQYELSVFENHLFHMIEQQHKLEEKVVNKHGSFRELYKDFCVIYVYVRHYALRHFGDVNGDKWKKILLKITYYIFYFGADEKFICDKTYQTLIERYGLEKEKLKFLIKELNDNQILKYMVNDKLIKTQKSEELGIYYRNLFNAIRYIDWECPDEDKKEYYAKLVRTNLSDFAQLMLYYNMQGERGSAWLEKDEVKDPKGDQDGCYSKNNKDGKTVPVKDCLLTRYLPIKNCAISVKNKDIDPRNDERLELFSDDVIDYELKIGD